MKYSFYLPTRGPSATPDQLVALVRHGEDRGFTSVMIADHVVFPVAIGSKYPYTVDGSFPGHGDALEQLNLMAFIAAKTERLRLVSSVMVLPLRNPVFTAKSLATIDVLSKGRVTVGVGVGWLAEEFAAMGAPPFNRRGAASNEYLEIFKKLWTQEVAEHDGEFYRFEALRCDPKPVQKPHPPIWIGGHSRAALKRTAKYGDGWHPVGANAAVPLTPAELAPMLSELKQLTAAEGRDFDDLTISFKAPVYDPGTPLPDGERRPFTGGDGKVIEDIHTYAGLGISELIFDFRSETMADSLRRMDEFTNNIMRPAEA
jgi:probable F420-dependent oxidoreductase